MKIKTLAQTMHEQNFTNSTLRGGPLEIPGGGGGVKIKKKICAMKNAWIVQPLRQRKKICASKQQSTNILEKKFMQRLNALKKFLQTLH